MSEDLSWLGADDHVCAWVNCRERALAAGLCSAHEAEKATRFAQATEIGAIGPLREWTVVADVTPSCATGAHEWVRHLTEGGDTGYLCAECDKWEWQLPAPRVTCSPRRPDLPAELRWEWGVYVDGALVGLGRQAECEALASELIDDPDKARSVVERSWRGLA